jgi:hypothetical protein
VNGIAAEALEEETVIHNTSSKSLYCVMERGRREAAKRLYEIAEDQ